MKTKQFDAHVGILCLRDQFASQCGGFPGNKRTNKAFVQQNKKFIQE